MDKLLKVLFDTKMTLGAEPTEDGKPAWVIRPAVGDDWYYAFRLPDKTSFEDAFEIFIESGAKILREMVNDAAEDLSEV